MPATDTHPVCSMRLPPHWYIRYKHLTGMMTSQEFKLGNAAAEKEKEKEGEGGEEEGGEEGREGTGREEGEEGEEEEDREEEE